MPICLDIYAPCCLVCKCGIYHLCPIFTPRFYIFATCLQGANLCKSRDLYPDNIRWEASALITTPSMFKKRVKEASKSVVGLQYGTGILVTSFPRSTEAFCHVIYYTNHLTKLQATSLDKDFEMRSKDCVPLKFYP